MCGLAGWARPADGDQPALQLVRDATSMLTHSIEMRGKHATGIALAGARPEDELLWKVADTASVVLKTEKWRQIVEENICATTMATQIHTRFATFDNHHRDDCAHPFKIGKVTGAHNGIIDNWFELEGAMVKAKVKDIADFQVDSQVIFALLDHYKDPRDALKQLEGYFAISWTKGKHLYLARSDAGSLYMAYVPAIKTMMWNSTKTALQTVLRSSGFDEKEYTIGELDSNIVYRFNIPNFNIKAASFDTLKAEKEWCPEVRYTRWQAENRTGSTNPNVNAIGGKRGSRRGVGSEWEGTPAGHWDGQKWVPKGQSSTTGSNVVNTTRSFSLKDMDTRIDGVYSLFNFIAKDVRALKDRVEELTAENDDMRSLLECFGVSWDEYADGKPIPEKDKDSPAEEVEAAGDEPGDVFGDESPYLGTAEERAALAMRDEAQQELGIGDHKPVVRHACHYCGNEGYAGHDLMQRSDGQWIGESCIFAAMDRLADEKDPTKEIGGPPPMPEMGTVC